jgi:protein CpxP
MTWLGCGLAMLALLAPAAAAGQSPDRSAGGAPPFLLAQAPGPAPGPAPSPGPAGPPPGRDAGRNQGPWWKDSEIVKRLQLSDAQASRIEQTYLDHRLRLVDLRADLEKEELRLAPLLDAEQPDEAKVIAQIDGITTARGKLEKENAIMLLAIRRVLTADQWKALQSLERERQTRRRPPRPGPPPPGPAPR